MEVEELIKAKTLIYSFLVMYEEASKVDEMIQEEIGDFEAIIQVEVETIDEIYGHFEFKDKRVTSHMNEKHENPDARIILEDQKAVRDFITGAVPAVDLFIKGRLKIKGPDDQAAMKKVLKMQSVYELLRFYIDPIKNVQRKSELQGS